MRRGFNYKRLLLLLLLEGTALCSCFGFRLSLFLQHPTTTTQRHCHHRTHSERRITTTTPSSSSTTSTTTTSIRSALAEDVQTVHDTAGTAMSDEIANRKFLIHWRGEKDPGYSKSFRHLEFESAIAAELAAQNALSTSSTTTTATTTTTTTTTDDDNGRKRKHAAEAIMPNVTYANALNYVGNESMTDMNIEHFNEAMQFVSFSFPSPDNDDNDDGGDDGDNVRSNKGGLLSKQIVIRAVERCSLVHGFYEIVASSDKLDDLADLAIADGGFADMYEGGSNEQATWCFRARMYNASEIPEETSSKGRSKRYSSRARSMKIEKTGLDALKDLLIRLGGRVNLEEPDCKIYLFDGLEEEEQEQEEETIDGGSSGGGGGSGGSKRVGRKMLARRIASGPKIFSIAPTERICVTNTPLEPIAAFCLCNIARIKAGDKILDPYAGSCTTLLAAAMIVPDAETVGIEIAHNGLVNREHIAEDFSSRNLRLPNQIIHGDSTSVFVRETAKEAVNHQPFDAIIADPPYGIRESVGYNDNSPLEELFASIAIDRHSTDRGRLLRVGGRLIAFVPVTDEQTLPELLPSEDLSEKAGLKYEVCREQPLNDKLSRWLVSYVCVE